MKLKLLLASTLLLSINYSHAQKQEQVFEAEEIQVSYHGLTPELRSYVEPVDAVNEITKTEKFGYHPKDWVLNQKVNPNALPQGPDPALQKDYAAPIFQKALEQSWDGMDVQQVSPADPSIDVGPNHVVQMINGPSGSYIQVYDKVGNTIGSQVYFDNFMSMPGGAGDPIVLYDERADRWLLSEFSTTGNNMHVAISQTADPAGAYHTYTFNAPSFPDYPKYSIWEDSYIITTNEANSRIYALNRTNLLAGTATPAISFDMTNFGTIGFQAATPVSLNGTVVPPANTPPMAMRMRDDAWSGVTNDALEIWDVNIDWSNTGAASLTQNIVLPMGSPFDSELCGFTSFSCINQPGSTTNLDPLREVLMNRIHYRNFGTHESIVCCHVTDVTGNDDAGIKWYELRRTGGSAGSWSIYQESTYSPDNASRWMPSIGISATGNIGLAYNITWDNGGNSIYPSVAYTGRKECDPLNTMTEPETRTAGMTGSAANGSNRYGDYNTMGLDPSDGETFYFGGIYNPTSAGRVKVVAFSIDQCAQNPEVAFQGTELTTSESDANTANGCLDYITIDLPIQIGTEPSANADLTLTVNGGTATQGEDFEIVTGTVTLNTTTVGNFQIRVFNDHYVEGDETIIVGYSLNNNGGDAYTGAINQTMTITINDDDVALANMANATVILSENFENGFGGFTTVNNGDSAATAWQIGDVAAGSSGAYAIPASNATQFAWINDDACNCDQNDVDLIFPSVDLSSVTGGSLTFDTYFEDNNYNGDNENADLYVSINGGADQLVGPLTASQIDVDWTTQNFDLTPYVGNNNVVFKVKYSDATGWLYGCTVDNVTITGSSPVQVQTAVNTTNGMTANLGPNGTVNYVDPTTGFVMATVENTSAFDYGCVTIEVDRAGTSAQEFNSANTVNYLADKTFKITPENNNPNGSYNVIFYYTEAEVAGWEAATGNNRSNAEIIKIAGNNAIDDVTPGNQGTFNITNAPSTNGTFNGDVSFTTSFNSGFSGFGLGILASANIPPTANFTSSTTATCSGATVQFTDLSGGTPTSWAWNFGDGSTSTSQNPTHTYAAPGTYTVSLTATNAFGNDTYSASNLITITNGFTTNQSVDICPGETVTVGSSTYNSAGTFTDVFTTSEGCDSTVITTVTLKQPSSSSQSINICEGGSYSIGGNTYTTAGTYTDVLTNLVGCDSTVTTNLTVDPLPTTDISPNQVEPICSTNSSPLTLVGSPAGGTFSGPGVSGNTFSASSAGVGTHTIVYTFTDGNNCVGTSEIQIEVVDCASIEENALSGVLLFPNPSDGTFAIQGMETGTEWEIFDAAGKIVAKGRVLPESGIEKVSIESVKSGVYTLRAKTNETTGTLRFIIAK